MIERMQNLLQTLRSRPVEEYLVALLGVLAVLTLVQGVRFVAAELQTTALQRSLALIGAPPPPRAEMADPKKYESILAKGLLGQPPKDGGVPDLKVFGILGKTALMGPAAEGVQPYEAGATLPGDAKLISIGTDAVTVEKNGKQQTLKVFDPANAPPDKPEEPKPEEPKPEKAKGEGPKPGPNGPEGPKPPEGMSPSMPPGGSPGPFANLGSRHISTGDPIGFIEVSPEDAERWWSQ